MPCNYNGKDLKEQYDDNQTNDYILVLVCINLTVKGIILIQAQ